MTTPTDTTTSPTRSSGGIDPKGKPPVPGAIWCGSCGLWAHPPAYMCRCNDR